MYSRLGMGEQWVTKYGICNCLPFLAYDFSAKLKNGCRRHAGLAWGIYWDLSPMCL